MNHGKRRNLFIRRLLKVVGVFALLGLIPVTVAWAPTLHPGSAESSGSQSDTRASPQPRLNITVSGRLSAEGDSLIYTVVARNIGTIPVVGLFVTQTLPIGLTFVSADHSGISESGTVMWHVDLPVTNAATMQVTTSVAPAPNELRQVATVACAIPRGAPTPIACIAHTDQIPATTGIAHTDLIPAANGTVPVTG